LSLVSPSRYDPRDIPGNKLFCFAQSCKGETVSVEMAPSAHGVGVLRAENEN